MKEKSILIHLNQALNAAPVDLLDAIKAQPIQPVDDWTLSTLQPQKSKTPPKWLSMVAAAVLMLAVGVNHMAAITVNSVVYLDVNPSLELKLNKKDTVIEIRPVNADARALLAAAEKAGHPIETGKDLSDTTRALLLEMRTQHYLKQPTDPVLLTIIHPDSKKGEALLQEAKADLHNTLDNKDQIPLILTQALTPQDAKAHEPAHGIGNGVSTGKQLLIQALQAQAPQLSTQDLTKLSLGQLIQLSKAGHIDLKPYLNDAENQRFHRLKPQKDGKTSENSQQGKGKSLGNQADNDDDEDEDDDTDRDNQDKNTPGKHDNRNKNNGHRNTTKDINSDQRKNNGNPDNQSQGNGSRSINTENQRNAGSVPDADENQQDHEDEQDAENHENVGKDGNDGSDGNLNIPGKNFRGDHEGD